MGRRHWIRITPTRGDETSSTRIPSTSSRDQPRARGRIPQSTPVVSVPIGSPPRGTTRHQVPAECRGQVTPRARGRDEVQHGDTRVAYGSPPRAGTRRKQQNDDPNALRIIPAGGDETSRHHSGACCSADHPRARGRDVGVVSVCMPRMGSPRRAGTRPKLLEEGEHHIGINPVHGDETSSPSDSPTYFDGLPPRAGTRRILCGLRWPEHGITPRAGTRRVSRRWKANYSRITPARGEETNTDRHIARKGWDHPRARGGDARYFS